jgi:hypothetical protein
MGWVYDQVGWVYDRGGVVSNVVQLFQHTSFDSETTRLMGAAYDKACQQLHDAGQPPLVQEIIAARILKLISEGERDPDRLCERTLQAIGLADYLRRHA